MRFYSNKVILIVIVVVILFFSVLTIFLSSETVSPTGFMAQRIGVQPIMSPIQDQINDSSVPIDDVGGFNPINDDKLLPPVEPESPPSFDEPNASSEETIKDKLIDEETAEDVMIKDEPEKETRVTTQEITPLSTVTISSQENNVDYTVDGFDPDDYLFLQGLKKPTPQSGRITGAFEVSSIPESETGKYVIQLQKPENIAGWESSIQTMSTKQEELVKQAMKNSILSDLETSGRSAKFVPQLIEVKLDSVSDLESIKNNPYVEFVEPDRIHYATLDTSVPLIDADDVWIQKLSGVPLDGRGQTICVLDTGIDYSHEGFDNCSITNQEVTGTPQNVLYESDHPYNENTTINYTITGSGFSTIAVHFDFIQTESGYDHINIMYPDGTVVDTITGSRNDYWSPSLNGDTVIVQISSDVGKELLGFRIDKILDGTVTPLDYNWTNCNKVVGGYDFVNDDFDPMDDHDLCNPISPYQCSVYHGTHCSGIAAGNSTETDYIGVAPGAKLVAGKVLSEIGSGNLADIYDGIQYCIDNADELNISVISMSLGDGTRYATHCDGDRPGYASRISAAEDAGISVIVATGNDGYYDGIGSPACISDAIPVTASTNSDTMASFANRNGLVSITAPGFNINSYQYNDSYQQLSGTSMATPHVAGSYALIKQYLDLSGQTKTSSEIETILELTGTPIVDGASSQTYYRPNLDEAINYFGGNTSIDVDVLANNGNYYFNASSPTIIISFTYDPDNISYDAYRVACQQSTVQGDKYRPGTNQRLLPHESYTPVVKNPTFEPPGGFEAILSVGSNIESAVPSFVDIDADGDYDLFIGIYSSQIDNRILYYENVGNTTHFDFQQSTDFDAYQPPTSVQSTSLAWGDLDDDGDYDAILAYEGGVCYYKNVGTSTDFDFQSFSGGSCTTNSEIFTSDILNYYLSNPSNTYKIAVGEFFPTIDDDVLIRFQGTSFTNVFKKNGNNKFDDADKFTATSYSHFADHNGVSMFDFGGDGFFEMFPWGLIGDNPYDIKYSRYEKRVSGDYYQYNNYYTNLVASHEAGTSLPPSLANIAFADLNDDGIVDFVVGSAGGSVYYVEGSTSGSVATDVSVGESFPDTLNFNFDSDSSYWRSTRYSSGGCYDPRVYDINDNDPSNDRAYHTGEHIFYANLHNNYTNEWELKETNTVMWDPIPPYFGNPNNAYENEVVSTAEEINLTHVNYTYTFYVMEDREYPYGSCCDNDGYSGLKSIEASFFVDDIQRGTFRYDWPTTGVGRDEVNWSFAEIKPNENFSIGAEVCDYAGNCWYYGDAKLGDDDWTDPGPTICSCDPTNSSFHVYCCCEVECLIDNPIGHKDYMNCSRVAGEIGTEQSGYTPYIYYETSEETDKPYFSWPGLPESYWHDSPYDNCYGGGVEKLPPPVWDPVISPIIGRKVPTFRTRGIDEHDCISYNIFYLDMDREFWSYDGCDGSPETPGGGGGFSCDILYKMGSSECGFNEHCGCENNPNPAHNYEDYCENGTFYDYTIDNGLCDTTDMCDCNYSVCDNTSLTITPNSPDCFCSQNSDCATGEYCDLNTNYCEDKIEACGSCDGITLHPTDGDDGMCAENGKCSSDYDGSGKFCTTLHNTTNYYCPSDAYGSGCYEYRTNSTSPLCINSSAYAECNDGTWDVATINSDQITYCQPDDEGFGCGSQIIYSGCSEELFYPYQNQIFESPESKWKRSFESASTGTCNDCGSYAFNPLTSSCGSSFSYCSESCGASCDENADCGEECIGTGGLFWDYDEDGSFDPDSGVCLDNCTCDTSSGAQNCSLNCAGASGAGLNCDADNPCSGDDICQNCICVDPGCTTHSDCSDGEYCDADGDCQTKRTSCSTCGSESVIDNDEDVMCESGACYSSPNTFEKKCSDTTDHCVFFNTLDNSCTYHDVGDTPPFCPATTSKEYQCDSYYSWNTSECGGSYQQCSPTAFGTTFPSTCGYQEPNAACDAGSCQLTFQTCQYCNGLEAFFQPNASNTCRSGLESCNSECGAECEADSDCGNGEMCTDFCQCVRKSCDTHTDCDNNEYCSEQGYCLDQVGACSSCGPDDVYGNLDINKKCSTGFCRSDYQGVNYYCANATKCVSDEDGGNCQQYDHDTKGPTCGGSGVTEFTCVNGFWNGQECAIGYQNCQPLGLNDEICGWAFEGGTCTNGVCSFADTSCNNCSSYEAKNATNIFSPQTACQSSNVNYCNTLCGSECDNSTTCTKDSECMYSSGTGPIINFTNGTCSDSCSCTFTEDASCVIGLCGATCESNDDCSQEETCANNCTCQPQSCESHDDCATGTYCSVGGVCEIERDDCFICDESLVVDANASAMCSGSFCVDDYNGVGSYCASNASQCPSSVTGSCVLYNDSQYLPECVDGRTESICSSGSWVQNDCQESGFSSCQPDDTSSSECGWKTTGEMCVSGQCENQTSTCIYCQGHTVFSTINYQNNCRSGINSCSYDCNASCVLHTDCPGENSYCTDLCRCTGFDVPEVLTWEGSPDNFTKEVGSDSLVFVGDFQITNTGNEPIDISSDADGTYVVADKFTNVYIDESKDVPVYAKSGNTSLELITRLIKFENSASNATLTMYLNQTVLTRVTTVPIFENLQENSVVSFIVNTTSIHHDVSNLNYNVYVDNTSCTSTSQVVLNSSENESSHNVTCSVPSFKHKDNYTFIIQTIVDSVVSRDKIGFSSDDVLDRFPPVISNYTKEQQYSNITDATTNISFTEYSDTIMDSIKILDPNNNELPNVLVTKNTNTSFTIRFPQSIPGDYNVVITAKDSSNNSQTSSILTEIYEKYDVPTHFGLLSDDDFFVQYKMFRPNTSIVLEHANSSNAGQKFIPFRNRFADIQITAFDIDLYLYNKNCSSISDYPISFTQVPAAHFPTIPEKKFLRGIIVDIADEDLDGKAKVSFDIDNIYHDVGKDLEIYRCPQWDTDANSCVGSWSEIPSTSDAFSNDTYAEVSGFSAYALMQDDTDVEIIEVTPINRNTNTDSDDNTNTINKDALKRYLNQQLDDAENRIKNDTMNFFDELFNQLGNTSKYFSVLNTDFDFELYPGEAVVSYLYIRNKEDYPLEINFNVSSELESFISIRSSQEIPANAEEIIPVFVRVPLNKSIDFFEGFIALQSNDSIGIPVTIRVRENEESLVFDVSSLEDELFVGTEALFDLTVNSLYPFIVTGTHELKIVSVDTGEVITSESKLIQIDKVYNSITKLKLPSNMSTGTYLVSTTFTYDGYAGPEEIVYDSFFVSVKPEYQANSFFFRTYLIPVWAWTLIILFLVIIYGVFRLDQYYHEKHKRFHLPVDQKELAMPGPRSVRVGNLAELETPYYFEIDKLLTHSVVAGSTGGGKSVTSQVYVEEALKVGSSVIIFDPTAQWSGFLRPNKDAHMFHLYSSFGLKKSDARGFPGNIRYVTNPLEILDIKKFMQPGEITIFALNHLSLDDLDIFVSNAIRAIFDARLSESPDLRLLVVFDEIHRLLPKYGGSGNGLLQVERGCREFRKWGVGLMLISQVLTDFVGTIQANINTQIQMHSSDEHDLNRLNENFGGDIGREIIRAPVGYGMLENSAYNKGKPFFVNFRPLLHSARRLSDDELERYKKYNDVMDQYYFDLDQLKAKGVDVFDLKLELDLAFKKVKEGQFNMVDVYIEGLKPRIVDVFKSNNLERAKYVPKLAKLDDVKAAIAHARLLQEEEAQKNKDDKK